MALRPAKAQLYELLTAAADKYRRLHAFTYAGWRLAGRSVGRPGPAVLEGEAITAPTVFKPAGIGTSVVLDNDEIEADIAAVRAAPEAQQEALVEELLAKYDKLWVVVARKYGRRYGIRQPDMDDAVQEVRLAAMKLLSEGIPPDVTWGQAIWRASESALSTWTESGGMTGFSGMTGHVRRYRSLAQMANGRPGLGGQELVETWNAKTAVSRADARRQGAVATVDDLVERQVRPAVDVMAPAEGRRRAYDEAVMDELLGEMVSEEMIELVVDACAGASELAGKVARTWLRGAVDDEAISGAEVARRLGVSRSTVLRAIGEVKMIARETMASYLARA